MSLFTLFMFVLGLSASIYILLSAMSRIIADRSNEEFEKKWILFKIKLMSLRKLEEVDSRKRLINYSFSCLRYLVLFSTYELYKSIADAINYNYRDYSIIDRNL